MSFFDESVLHTGFANATGGETLQAELEGTGGFKVIFGWKKFFDKHYDLLFLLQDASRGEKEDV